jgi:hypothetical protein
MKHEFHFVLNKKMKKEIIVLSKKLKKSMSSTIVYIINNLNPILERYHYVYPENKEDGRYRLINGKKHIHIYMDEVDYRRIKQVFANMYIYSMAIIIRRMIRIYIDEINRYGIKRFEKIMLKYGKINDVKFKREGRKKWEKYEIVQQMSYNKVRNKLYKTTFTANYTLLGFEILQI